LLGDELGVTFSFLIFVDDEVLEGFFVGGDGLTSDFFSFLTITGVMELDFL
jgi:hypothetical protein